MPRHTDVVPVNLLTFRVQYCAHHLDILGLLLTGEAKSPSDAGRGDEHLDAPDSGTSATLDRSCGGVISLLDNVLSLVRSMLLVEL